MSKAKNQQETSGLNLVLGPGVPAPNFKLRSAQSLRQDCEPLDVNPGAEGILDALEAPDSKREVAA
jgi:hypothetical protein